MFDEMRDLFAATMLKRLSSPFVSTFILSTIVTNYDIVFLLLDGQSWYLKSDIISGIFSVDNYLTSSRFLFPLGFTSFYVFFWPFIDMQIYRWTHWLNNKYKEIQKKIVDEKPMTREEENKFKQRWINENSKLRAELSDKSLIIEDLHAQASGAKNSFTDLEEKVSRLENEKKDLNSKIDLLTLRLNSNKKLEESSDSDDSLVFVKMGRDYPYDFGLTEDEPPLVDAASEYSIDEKGAVAATEKGRSIAEKMLSKSKKLQKSRKEEDLKNRGSRYIGGDLNFKYMLSDDVLKKSFVKGTKLSKIQELIAKPEVLSEKVMEKLLEVHYDKVLNDIPQKQLLSMISTDEVHNSRAIKVNHGVWVSNDIDIVNLTDKIVFERWFQLYLERENAIKKYQSDGYEILMKT